MQKRRRIKQTASLADRLSRFAKEAAEKALNLPPGAVRDELLKKVSQERRQCDWSAGAPWKDRRCLAAPAMRIFISERATHDEARRPDAGESRCCS
jgi:hypothetical protein